jgi:hypothetical protein
VKTIERKKNERKSFLEVGLTTQSFGMDFFELGLSALESFIKISPMRALKFDERKFIKRELGD